MSIIVTSPSFQPDGPMPRKYTEDGENISPPLVWAGLPSGRVELALIVDDPDAPRPEPWVHWVICKIPPNATSLPEAVPRESQWVQGVNTWGRIGYDGPAPPKGHGTHHYHFRLYALNGSIKAQGGIDKDALLKLMSGHIIAQGELIGTYER